MMTKTECSSRPASGSFDGFSRSLGQAAVDAAKRFCMTRVPRLVGLGLALGIILAAGDSMAGDQQHSRVPTCSSGASSPSLFKILDNQTYALCAVSSCLVFNGVAYCKCDVKSGDSISLSLKFDTGQNVCTVNEEGVANGSYMVSTFSVPDSVLKPNGDQAIYTCPGKTSNGAYAQCDGGICFNQHPGEVIPGIRTIGGKRDHLLLPDHHDP